MNLDQVHEQISTQAAEGKLDSAPAPKEESQQSAQAESNQQSQLTELEKLERFSYKGKEWTPKDLESAILMQSDYTKKTQAIAEERKYYENLPHDLMRVAAQPGLAEEFKRIYPEKFHNYLTAIEQQNNQGVEAQVPSQAQKPGIDPEFVSRFERLESAWKEQEIKTAETKIEQVFSKMKSKYEYVDEEQVIARAQHALSKGEKLDDSAWEKIFKTVNDLEHSKFQAWHKKQVATQQEAHQKGKDIGGGGGIPGQAPKKLSSFKDAEQAMMDALSQQ
jgi:hypothetical protein